MAADAKYAFRRADLSDLTLLNTWRRTPPVAKWWDDDFDARDLKDTRVAPWIVSLDSVPFAYIQDYDVHGWEGHPFAHLPRGARGIDQFIGLPEMLNKGHGTAFIRARVAALFADGALVVTTDPNPDNARAIAAYEKVGFAAAGAPRDTYWGRILPMEIRPEGLRKPDNPGGD